MHHHPRVSLIAAVVAMISIGGCDSKLIAPTAPPSGTSSCTIGSAESCQRTNVLLQTNQRFGLVTGGLDDPNLTGTQVRRILGHAKQSGAGFALEAIYWDQAQKTWGQFDSTYMASVDTFVRAAIDSGITPVLKFQNSPAWARFCDPDPHGPDCDTTSTIQSPPHPALFNAWQSFISDVLDRYPQVKYWGVWNEPNVAFVDPVTGDTGRFLNHNGYATWLDAYRPLFLYADDVIQSKPGRVLVGPELGWWYSDQGLTPEVEFQNFMNALAFRFRPQDIISTHYYGTPADLATRIPLLHSYATNAARGSNEIWVTEVAYGDWNAEGNDDHFQAQITTQFYQTFLSTSANQVPQWTKMFKFLLWNQQQVELIHNAGTATPTFRSAYYCFQALARGFALPSNCH